jgi:hypothetical protein
LCSTPPRRFRGGRIKTRGWGNVEVSKAKMASMSEEEKGSKAMKKGA